MHIPHNLFNTEINYANTGSSSNVLECFLLFFRVKKSTNLKHECLCPPRIPKEGSPHSLDHVNEIPRETNSKWTITAYAIINDQCQTNSLFFVCFRKICHLWGKYYFAAFSTYNTKIFKSFCHTGSRITRWPSNPWLDKQKHQHWFL